MVKTLFIGSNWEALSTLKVLHEDSRFHIVGLITQPDKKVGRKQEVEETQIKQYAQQNGIEVFYTLKDPDLYRKALEKFQPELIVCKSFGEIIPGFFLEFPKYKAINVHYSLLPKYRGAVPIQMAIMNGEETTGITYVQMVEKMDAGDILHQIEEKILPDDTNQSLRERLVQITGETIGDVLQKWVDGEIEVTPQNEEDATFCWQKDISKEAAFVEFDKISAIELDRKVLALIPWPVVWTLFEGKRLKIYKVALADDVALKPGEFLLQENQLYVGTSDGSVELIEVQPEGKRVMDGAQFGRGNLG